MAINIIDGFFVGAPYPVDSRITATDSSVRESIEHKYDGLKVFQLDDRNTYTWNESTATWSDDSTGIITSSGGTLNFVPRFSSSYVISNSILFTDHTNGFLLINNDSSVSSANTPRTPLQINEKSSSLPPINFSFKGNSGDTHPTLSYNFYYDSGLATDNSFDNTKPSSIIYLNSGTSPNDGFEFLHRVASSGAGAFTTVGKIYRNSTIGDYQSQWPSGASSSPGISFINQTGTGLFYAAPDLGVSLSGVQVLRISSSNNLGIGTHQPQSKLHLDSGNAAASYLKFTAGTTTGVSSSDGFDVGINASGIPILNSRDNNTIKFQFSNTDYLIFGTSSAVTLDMFGSGVDFIKDSYSYASFLAGGGGLGSPTTQTLTHSFVGTSNDEVVNIEATVVTYIKAFGSANYGGTHKLLGSFKKVGSTTYTQIGNVLNVYSTSDAAGGSSIGTPTFSLAASNTIRVTQANTIAASGEICESWCYFKVVQINASSFA